MNTNRLINEKSPYLLQHAHNPVDWYSWNDAAFSYAAEKNMPVFLSIGYAACHWCHVMEKETFDDKESAQFLNDTFVCIKVDREERPDIDSVYMTACQIITGSGGWPLTIFMTPDRKPFFAATYIPKISRFERPGIIDLCKRVKLLWQFQRDKIIESANQIIGSLKSAFIFSSAEEPDKSIFDSAYMQIAERFDPQFGGFESSPKFPMPHRLIFLIKYYHQTGQSNALDMVKKSLTAMRLGGIWDHVGFGFHRYSTDRRWLLPHFEKMLYDQAMLSLAAIETFKATNEEFYARIAHDIFTYVLRDMTSDKGGFFSAEDADSEGEEGRFYVWLTKEFRDVIGQDKANRWEKIFHLEDNGNFREEASGKYIGANILYTGMLLETWAEKLKIPASELYAEFESVIQLLFRHRENRIRPLKDDKILTSWNGLMIAALSVGARVLKVPEYAKYADAAARFILTNFKNQKGRLLHRYRDGEAGINAFADDYAFFIFGLISLFESVSDQNILQQALILQDQMIDDFWDHKNGGFFLTSKRNNDLPVRPKEITDNAIPSANSVSLFNLFKLFHLTGDKKYEHRAKELSRAFSGTIKKQPAAFTFFLAGNEGI